MASFFAILMAATSLFLVLLVLVQRGRGGGLAGALGGMGGQSAFGTKAGDTFTRVTIGVAGFWIMLCLAAAILLRESGPLSGSGPATTNPAGTGAAADGNAAEGGAAEAVDERHRVKRNRRAAKKVDEHGLV